MKNKIYLLIIVLIIVISVFFFIKTRNVNYDKTVYPPQINEKYDKLKVLEIEKKINKLKKEKKYYNEFLEIEKFLNLYIGSIDEQQRKSMILREYEIGNIFYTKLIHTKYSNNKEEDKNVKYALEIYESILKHLTEQDDLFIDTLMRICFIYNDFKKDKDKIISILTSIIENDKIKDKDKIHAYNTLIDVYINFIEQNYNYYDYLQRVKVLLNQLKSKYAKDKNILEHNRKMLQKIDELEVKKILNKAIFYYKKNKTISKKYLEIIKSEYPNTKYINKVNELLEKMS